MPRNQTTPSSFEDATLGFVFKSLINRDPNKRRIKPVESILAMDADLGDSESDDSDYNPTNVEDDDIEIESDGDNEKEKNGENDDDDVNRNSSDESDSEEEEEDNDDADDCILSEKKAKQLYNELFEKDSEAAPVNGESESKTTVAKVSQKTLAENYKKIVICSVCLGDVSQSEDEIVECDACGISVHEMCYGITADDAESIHSNASSASTEPWFCDPCKAGVKNPNCELCPNSNGIYKITDNGRWVHMVCALYTHGITFVDYQKLRGPVLSDINFNRWGAKVCILCEDERFSQTGVCICCDAGMCKTYFHVTCAQREGLLTELRHSEEVELDPYIAYCRLHSDRNAGKKKRRNYLALIARNRYLMKSLKQNDHTIEESITNQRTLSKLFTQREKFLKSFQAIENYSSASSKRIPRLLEASPSAMRRLNTRSQLSGYSSKRSSYLIPDDVSDIRRKWYIQPAFSIEYISYYIDRNERIDSMEVHSQELMKENKQLKELESNLFAKYSDALNKSEKLKAENAAIRAKIIKYLSILTKFTPQTLAATDEERIKSTKFGQTILALPEMQAHVPSVTKTKNWNSGGSGGSKPFELKNCATCKKTKDQHLMALCDSCHLYYHLSCLDPPLRRMPKKTRFGGWQCSNCTEKDEEENEQEMARLMEHSESDNPNSTVSSVNENESSDRNSDVNASTAVSRRRLRENPKAATKYSEHEDTPSGTISNTPNPRGRPPRNPSGTTGAKRGRKPKNATTSGQNIPVTQTPAPASRKRRLSSSQSEKAACKEEPTKSHTPPKKSLPVCVACNQEVQVKQSVRCDNCQNNYHFGCLKPPCIKNPKRRGYTWCCFVCEKKGDKRSEHMDSKHESDEERVASPPVKIIEPNTSILKKIKTDSESDSILLEEEKPIVVNSEAEQQTNTVETIIDLEAEANKPIPKTEVQNIPIES